MVVNSVKIQNSQSMSLKGKCTANTRKINVEFTHSKVKHEWKIREKEKSVYRSRGTNRREFIRCINTEPAYSGSVDIC